MTSPPVSHGGMSVDPTSLVGSGSGIGRQLASTVVAIVLGLLVGAVLILVSSALSEEGLRPTLPIEAYASLLSGSLGDARGWANTMNSATPLILAGLSVAFGFRAGLFNIGAQGQFFLGAFAGAIFGGVAGIPFPLHILVAVFGGFLFGGLWGFIPGLLKAWRGAHEVVTTIMLNSIAALGLNWLAATYFRDPGATFPRTPDALPSALLPTILEGTRMHAGILVALAAAVAVWFVLFKTTLGFEIRTVGSNPDAARYAGIRPALITVLTMSIAGGLAGTAGAIEILGITKNYPAEYNTTYGFDAIAVALLGRAHPFGVVGAALLFGVLRAGAGAMQRETGIPIDIISVVQGAIILFVAAEVVIRRLLPRIRRAGRGPTRAPSAA